MKSANPLKTVRCDWCVKRPAVLKCSDCQSLELKWRFCFDCEKSLHSNCSGPIRSSKHLASLIPPSDIFSNLSTPQKRKEFNDLVVSKVDHSGEKRRQSKPLVSPENEYGKLNAKSTRRGLKSRYFLPNHVKNVAIEQELSPTNYSSYTLRNENSLNEKLNRQREETKKMLESLRRKESLGFRPLSKREIFEENSESERKSKGLETEYIDEANMRSGYDDDLERRMKNLGDKILKCRKDLEKEFIYTENNDGEHLDQEKQEQVVKESVREDPAIVEIAEEENIVEDLRIKALEARAPSALSEKKIAELELLLQNQKSEFEDHLVSCSQHIKDLELRLKEALENCEKVKKNCESDLSKKEEEIAKLNKELATINKKSTLCIDDAVFRAAERLYNRSDGESLQQ